jgi:hypothetical protein
VKAVRAGRCPTAFTLGTTLAVWTTKAINAAANLDGNGKAKLCFVDLALFLMMRIAASACGVWDVQLDSKGLYVFADCFYRTFAIGGHTGDAKAFLSVLLDMIKQRQSCLRFGAVRQAVSCRTEVSDHDEAKQR